MAKTPVSLKIDNCKEREVLSFDYKFHQATDPDGQVNGLPRGGELDIVVKALNDGTSDLLQWIIGPYDLRNITVEFKETITGKIMKTFTGKNCLCIHFDEKWEDKKVHLEHIVIACQELTNDSAKYTNVWT